MRFPNQRLAQLFTLLRNETLPQDELAQRLSVSTRTVRADITALNTLLAQYGAQFILNRGSGYQLKIDNPTSFQALEETAPKAQHVPRTAQDRITFLLVRFLTSAFSIKLEDLADEWFVSRATLQNDMVEVRERFQRYQLTLETRPRHGMKLFGSEVSIRACLTDLLWELTQQGDIAPPIGAEAFAAEVPALLDNIKQHYPMAWDMTLAAVSSWGKYTPYTISENEIGFLVLHIGVGLERHYNIGYQRQPQVLLVCDTSNAMVRMIEAILQRKYPQLEIAATISQREYEQRDAIEADFVISTVRIGEKDKPVVTIAPFPTDYQLDQIGKLVLVDRTRPWMLNKYFDAAHFRVVDKPMDQQTLFAELCQQLLEEGFVDAEFHASVVEREAIVSTMLGDGIALPHSLGLLAKKTVVYTVIAPQGIAWGDETAHLIFLLAISKREYEEAMAIYDIFVTFLRERAMSRLAATRSFDEFKTVAMECVSRF